MFSLLLQYLPSVLFLLFNFPFFNFEVHLSSSFLLFHHLFFFCKIQKIIIIKTVLEVKTLHPFLVLKKIFDCINRLCKKNFSLFYTQIFHFSVTFSLSISPDLLQCFTQRPTVIKCHKSKPFSSLIKKSNSKQQINKIFMFVCLLLLYFPSVFQSSPHSSPSPTHHSAVVDHNTNQSALNRCR